MNDARGSLTLLLYRERKANTYINPIYLLFGFRAGFRHFLGQFNDSGGSLRLPLNQGHKTNTYKKTRFISFSSRGNARWEKRKRLKTRTFTLTEAVASVMPGREVFVKSGSRLEVVCQVEGCPPPALLAWTRGGQKVHMPDSLRYDLSKNNGTLPVSRLTLARQSATASDSGNYSCTSTCTIPINVTVHVLRGEAPSCARLCVWGGG